MNMRLILAAGLLLGLSGCATYDYVGGGSGGYYHGAPSVQRSYPYGYPYGSYGYDPYGYGSYGYSSYFNYGYGYPVYRDRYIVVPSRPQNGHGNGHRPPQGHGNGNGHWQPRPGNNDGRPQRPPPVNGGGSKAPWRDMDRLQRPQPRTAQPSGQRIRPQAMGTPRPAMQPRQMPSRPASQSRGSYRSHRSER